MIAGELLQHVPGCENGDAPFSQELHRRRQGQSQFPGAHAPRPIRRAAQREHRGGSRPRSRSRARAAHRGGERRHRAAGGLRGARSLLPDHRLRRRPAVDAALLHAHARPAFARPAPAHVARAGAAVGDALRSAGRRAPLCRPHRAAAIRDEGGAHPVLVRPAAPKRWRAPASTQRAPAIVHSDLHHGNVLTADRVYFIDWEYAQVGDPLLDLACIMAYYPRAMPHGALLLEAAGLDERRHHARDARRAHQRIHAADISLVPRAPRWRATCPPPTCSSNPRPCAACFRWRPTRNLGTLAPRICANLQVSVKRNGDVAGD